MTSPLSDLTELHDAYADLLGSHTVNYREEVREKLLTFSDIVYKHYKRTSPHVPDVDDINFLNNLFLFDWARPRVVGAFALSQKIVPLPDLLWRLRQDLDAGKSIEPTLVAIDSELVFIRLI